MCNRSGLRLKLYYTFTECISNCELCSEPRKCDVCKPGFCYDEEERICRPNEGRNCQFCEMRDAGVSCLTCEDTTYLDRCQRKCSC